MYTDLKDFLKRLGISGGDSIRFSPEDTRLAIAVLYYRVILVDGRVREEEIERYRAILANSLQVNEDELLLFEEKVLELSKSSSTAFPMIDIVRKLPEERKFEILLHMHQISISDRELHEFEINLVVRAAEILEVDASKLEITMSGAEPFSQSGAVVSPDDVDDEEPSRN